MTCWCLGREGGLGGGSERHPDGRALEACVRLRPGGPVHVSEGRLALTPAVPSQTSPSFPTTQQSLSLTFLAVLLTLALWEGQPGRSLFLPFGLRVTEYLAWVLEGRIHRWWRPSACPGCCPSAELKLLINVLIKPKGM